MELSGRHIFWLMFTFELGDMILITISPTINGAKQDAWMSHILGTVFAVIIVYIAIKVAEQFPEDTFMQYTKKLIGKFFAGIIILLYLIQWSSVLPMILVETANFINTILLPETPAFVIYLLFFLLLIYIMFNNGIETIGLISEVFGPIILFFLMILIALVSKEFQFNNLLPVYYDNSLKSIVKTSIIPFSFLGESVVMLMLVYYTEKGVKIVRNALWGMLLSAFLSGILLFGVLLTFGPDISGKMLYPAFDMISYIFIMEFIQNIEILAVFVALLSIFIKICIYFFLICIVISQFFKIEKWYISSLYIAPALLFISVNIPNISTVLEYANTFWIYIVVPIHMILIPTLLLMIAKIKKVYQGSK